MVCYRTKTGKLFIRTFDTPPLPQRGIYVSSYNWIFSGASYTNKRLLCNYLWKVDGNGWVSLIPNSYVIWATGNVSDTGDDMAGPTKAYIQQHGKSDRGFTDNAVNFRFPEVMPLTSLFLNLK